MKSIFLKILLVCWKVELVCFNSRFYFLKWKFKKTMICIYRQKGMSLCWNIIILQSEWEQRQWFTAKRLSCTRPGVGGPVHSSHRGFAAAGSPSPPNRCEVHCARALQKQQAVIWVLRSVFIHARSGTIRYSVSVWRHWPGIRWYLIPTLIRETEAPYCSGCCWCLLTWTLYCLCIWILFYKEGCCLSKMFVV